MLGLGLGLHKSTMLLSNLKLLTRNSDWAIWGDKATGTSKGTNSPQVNPIVDLVGNADGTLQGFGFIPTSGYVDVPIKGVGDEISYTNLVANGDLIDSNADNLADSWSTLFGVTNLSCANNVQKFTPSAQYGQVKQDVVGGFSVGQRWYASSLVKATKPNVNFSFQSGAAQTITSESHSGSGLIEKLSTTITIINANALAVIRLRDDNASAWAEIEFTKPIMIRLDNNTQVQALESKLGRQLTAAECDYLFDFTATTNTIKAKTVTGIQGDGVNDVILLPSNAPNPVGLQDFGFAFVYKTITSGTPVGQIMIRSANDGIVRQYAFFIDTSVLNINIGGNPYPSLISIVQNTFYKIVVLRKSGRLIVKVNGAEVYNQPNAISIVSQPNARIFARTNGDSSTHTFFNNGILFYADYNNGDNIDAWESDQNKAIAKIYGL